MGLEPSIWQLIGLTVCVAAVVAMCVTVMGRFRTVPDPSWEPQTRADCLVAEWAEEAGYELLAVSPGSTYTRPQLDEFGFAHLGRSGVVRRITVRDDNEEMIRQGWVFVAAACAVSSGVYSPSGPTPADYVEVAWDE